MSKAGERCGGRPAKDLAQAHQISAETQKTHSGADTAIKTALDMAKIREVHARALKLETEAAYPQTPAGPQIPGAGS